jgi:hypothetical protein
MSIHRLAPAAWRPRAAFWVVLLAAAAAAAGCGKHAVATVRGKVTFNNQPVGAGTVYFVGADNTTAEATLADDGTYTMKDAPVGDVRIGVKVPARPMPGTKMPTNPLAAAKDKAPPEAAKMMDPAAPGGTHWMPVPDKYNNFETSGLTWTVPAGGGEHDIPLTP